jgi:SAM-dependent methyltransferase
VLNVGAGTGSYEPADREVVAVEPSALMRAQRPASAARVVDAHAEALPFPDASFEATLAVLSDHHWADREAGLRELRRVASRRAVVFTFDGSLLGQGWLGAYLPELSGLAGASLAEVSQGLGATDCRPVPVPRDCRDGFLHAYWARPRAYLDPEVRAAISVFALLETAVVSRFVEELRADLESGAWRSATAIC